jgi:replicative DNA helicase
MSQERTIITMMIVSDEFLNQIAPVLKPKYFKSKYTQIVSEWVLEYWNQYRQAPQKNIQTIYQNKLQYIRDEDETETVMHFIKKLSEDWVKQAIIQNIDFQINNTIQYLKIRSLELLSEDINQAVSLNDPIQGEQVITQYNRIEKSGVESIRILKDHEKIKEAFTNESEIVFRFPGVLGDICGDFLRGDLAAFLAAPKRGKSWWQWVLASMAMQSHARVVFFSLEMTERQVLRRAWCSLEGKPKKDMTVKIPYFEKQNDKYRVMMKEKKMKGIDVSKIQERQNKLKMHFRGGDVLIKVMPANAVTISTIEMELDNIIYYDDFIPDIVIIDYADNIKPSIKGEYRHQIDNIWKELRRIALDKNMLVVTASQTNRGAINQDADRSHIAEDIRKLAHVAKLIVLNQSKDEKMNNIIRVGSLAERDGPEIMREARVIYCYEIGQPYIDSRYKSEVIFEKNKQPDG